MDGDDFSRATRLGRAVAEAIVSVGSTGASFDAFTTAQLLDHFIGAAGGIPSLPLVLAILDDLRATPLLLPARIEEGCARVDGAIQRPESGILDMLLAKVTQGALLRGNTDPASILESFTAAFIERHVITGRGGLVELDGLRFVELARELTAPLARAAASVLLQRPNAQRLGLARAYRRGGP